MTIGRANDCVIVLQDGGVSRHHAVIESTPAGYRLRDTGSANGVIVADERRSEVVLADGLQFGIGDTVFEFVNPPVQPAPPTDGREFVIRIVGSTAPDAIDKEFVVSGVVSIGRGGDCTIPLKDRTASQRHALVQIAGDGFRVIDNASANGVWLDDRRVTDTVLTDGQRFRVGDTFLECHPKIEEAGRPHDADGRPRPVDGQDGRPAVVRGGRGHLRSAAATPCCSTIRRYVYYVVSGRVGDLHRRRERGTAVRRPSPFPQRAGGRGVVRDGSPVCG